jgi:hypothetical protein
VSYHSFSALSSFYYVESITSNNFYLDFDEGGGELSVEIETGDYTPEELANIIEAGLNATTANAFVYTVTFDRSTRRMTLACDNPVDFLVSTGTHNGNDVFPLIGFTGADRTGASSYLANNVTGSEYVPQFPLQEFVDQEDLQKSVSASINKSANGIVEVVSFGTEKFYEFNIMFATNLPVGNQGPIRNSATGLSDLRLFMRYLVSK